MRSSEWADYLDPLIADAFDQGLNRRPFAFNEIFSLGTSDNYQEEFGNIGDIDIAAWDTYESDGVVAEASLSAGYTKTLVHQEKVMELPIERKLLEDNKLPTITDAATRLGNSAARKMEADAVSVFNNAFSGSFVGGDGVALCSASHPAGPSNPAKTQDNTGTAALTEENLSAAIIAISQFTSDKGNLLGAVGDLLIVGTAQWPTATKLVASMQEPGSGNNAVNPNAGMRAVVWNGITGNKWFVADSMLMADMLKWINRIPLGVNRKVQDETVLATWIARMRYSYGFTGWQWVYGNNQA
jgi:phage major head subunit gpT-like protein